AFLFGCAARGGCAHRAFQAHFPACESFASVAPIARTRTSRSGGRPDRERGRPEGSSIAQPAARLRCQLDRKSTRLNSSHSPTNTTLFPYTTLFRSQLFCLDAQLVAAARIEPSKHTSPLANLSPASRQLLGREHLDREVALTANEVVLRGRP